MSQQEKAIKTIRITNDTYQKLVARAKYSDSMDKLINKILSQAEADKA
jgi:hypothetical protein